LDTKPNSRPRSRSKLSGKTRKSTNDLDDLFETSASSAFKLFINAEAPEFFTEITEFKSTRRSLFIRNPDNFVTIAVRLVAKKGGTGMVFDSSTLFTYPNGARRSPDAAWVKREKWDALPAAEKKKFSKLAPDFVVELRSGSDSLKTLQRRMAEYITNGVRLAWLVDPIEKQVSVYRQNGEIEVMDNPGSVSGEDVLPGFTLDPRQLW
jgi:Uma2 family endonuclease